VPTSMTGYGSAELAGDGRRIRVEIRSLNNRFLDVQIKAPRQFLGIEDRIRSAVEGALERGRVTVYLDWRESGAGQAPRIRAEAARALVDSLRAARDDLDLSGEIDVGVLARFPQVFEQDEETPEADALWSAVEPVLSEAIGRLVVMRAEEGRRLGEDLVGRTDRIAELVGTIESAAPAAALALKQKLAERIRSLIDSDVTLDEGRLEQELSIASERADFTEEVVRLGAHIGQVRDCLASDGPIGKRLNFLVQELHREVNTIGSKNSNVDLTRTVVDLKEEVEKLREQVQNVE